MVLWGVPLAAVLGSLWAMRYVYCVRGTVRFDSFSEYLRKGWPIFAPINAVLYACTRPHGRAAILNNADFPEYAALREHWPTLQSEAQRLKEQGFFEPAKDQGQAAYYDIGFRTFTKYGWSKFYLTWYGYTHHSARALCPQTVEILKQIPGINGAMFSLLPARSILSRHMDPIAASLRLHLGLATPNNDACFIQVDNRTYSWRDGDILLFDETYLHHVRNDTDQDRLILMCDVRRPLTLPGRLFNACIQALLRLSVVPNTSADRRGLVNRLFSGLSPLLARTKALKETNRPLYLLIKWSVNLTLLALMLGLLGLATWGILRLLG